MKSLQVNTPSQEKSKIMAERQQLRVVIKHLRGVLSLTQEQLARRMGTVVRTVARWESESEPVDSLPAEVVMQLLHLAVEAEDGASFHYFQERVSEICRGPDATEWTRHVFRFLPWNQKEIEAVGELLRRMREGDPAIRPILKQLDALLKQRVADEEQVRQEEAQRYAARGPELEVTWEELKERALKQIAAAKARRGQK
jgi:DNA-binding transcriptional regulator YiaG